MEALYLFQVKSWVLVCFFFPWPCLAACRILVPFSGCKWEASESQKLIWKVLLNLCLCINLTVFPTFQPPTSIFFGQLKPGTIAIYNHKAITACSQMGLLLGFLVRSGRSGKCRSQLLLCSARNTWQQVAWCHTDDWEPSMTYSIKILRD